MRRYTNDVIASTAFGIQVNSVQDKDNDFYKTGQSMFKLSAQQRFKFFLVNQFPALAKVYVLPQTQTVNNFYAFFLTSIYIYKLDYIILFQLLKLKVFDDKYTNFFNNIVNSTMQHREKHNIERPDIIQLLMQALKGKL